MLPCSTACIFLKLCQNNDASFQLKNMLILAKNAKKYYRASTLEFVKIP